MEKKNRSYPGHSGCTHAYKYNCNYSRVIGLEVEDISGGGGGSSYSFNGPSDSKGSDTEYKRKKRIASYNVLSAEGRLKSTFTNSFKWIKAKFSDLPYSPRDDF